MVPSFPLLPPSFRSRTGHTPSTFQGLVEGQFGLGRSSAQLLAALAGLSPLSRPATLPPSLLRGVDQLSLPHAPLVGRSLKKQWLGRIRFQQKLGTLAGLRHGLRLPVRGQRTHSNGRTVRRTPPPTP